MRRCVLVIAGLDPSGGAGLIADVAVVRAAGLWPAAVASALTVQDSARCDEAMPVAVDLIERQIAMLVGDLAIRAVKVGMLGSAAVAAGVARALGPLSRAGVPIVVDPVLRASVGAALLEGDPREALAPMLRIATLLTPNRSEAEALVGFPVDKPAAQTRAAAALRTLGASAVLVKGGHLYGDVVVDVLDDGNDALALSAPRVTGASPHGTGCALSTAIACFLATGLSLREAVTHAHAAVHKRIAEAQRVGKGRTFLGDA